MKAYDTPMEGYAVGDYDQENVILSRMSCRWTRTSSPQAKARPYGGRRLLVSWRGLPPLGR
jgi:hypothetical protein